MDRVAQAAEILSGQLGMSKVVSSGADYDDTRRIWNAAVTYMPRLIVLCENTNDVRLAVAVAATYGVSVSVRGGGHDWAGRSLRGEMVLDLRRMRDVTVDGLVATVGGGAITTEVANVVCSHGLSIATGIIGSVGMAGLALGGGYGHLTARLGLALDNILGAEIVIANGDVVQADKMREPDLFWALRGGGGNFGVVTKLTLQLHPIPDLSDGIIVFPWEQAQEVFKVYNLLLVDIADQLTLMPTFFAAPDGKLSIMLHHAWSGPQSEDEVMIDRVKKLGVPDTVLVSKKSLSQILQEAERRTMKGIHWIVRTVTLAELDPGAIEVICRAMEQRSSPLSWIASHPFYGFGERIPVESTAFGIRSRHFMVGIYAAWEPGDESPHRAWADGVEKVLEPYALESFYPNYFGSDRPLQAAKAYGVNTNRLLAVKKRYDPGNMFAAISLPSSC